uniref:Uncharacterized protein n=1 Tax=Avena sativa TaxID=4498 RepID=A0ACD6A4T1_AVESA
MDLSGGRGELPIPMHTPATPYGAIGGGGGMPMELHHDHHNGQSQQAQGMPSSPPSAVSEESSGKKRSALVLAGAGAGAGIGGGPAAKYRECLKNHAAAIGGNATDGCGEFMPSGEEGSLEALKCSACGCHRNFHRKELDDLDGGDSCAYTHGYGHGHRVGRRLLGPAMPQHHQKSMGGLLVTADHYGAGAYAAATRALPPPGHPHHQIIMPLSMIHTSTESDEMDGSGGGGVMGDALGPGGGSGGGGSSSSQKRFRTKFSAEQKARMLDFAERVGWRLQKLDDAMVQQFCQEIGVKRRVLKVWMHNNKHNLAKRPLPASPPQHPQPQPHPMPIAMQSPPMPMPMPMSMMAVQASHQQPGPSFHREPSSPQQQHKPE